MTFAAQKEKLNVHQFPRPPALEKCMRHVKVTLDGVVIADSNDAYWVLETTHPPTYYVPPEHCQTQYLSLTSKSSFCEWKGMARYYDAKVNDVLAQNRCWFYGNPSTKFVAIRDYISFYCGPFECFVNGERVLAQPGDFYGGWMTAEIDGGKKGVKGGPGTAGW
jgi:uncharacterized protein (DUF427 family)